MKPQPWADQDWSKTDLEIAKSRGISRQAVNHMRHQLGAPSPPKKLKPLTQRDALDESLWVIKQLAKWNEYRLAEHQPENAKESWAELEKFVDSLLNRWPKQ